MGDIFYDLMVQHLKEELQKQREEACCKHEHWIDGGCGAALCTDCGRRGEYTYGTGIDWSDEVLPCSVLVQDGFCLRTIQCAMVALQKGVITREDFRTGDESRWVEHHCPCEEKALHRGEGCAACKAAAKAKRWRWQ
jgi:hypothetical protein